MTTHTTRQQPLDATDCFTRRAPIRATTFDLESGTFSAVIATETPVARRDFGEEYLEVLSLKPSAVRLERLNSGASPLLDSHRAGSVKDQIGNVSSARIEGGQLVATARLSPRDDVRPIATDLAAGTPPNVSVGYRVFASSESRTPDGRLVITRTDWEPFEMSFVPIPADPKTHVRNQQGLPKMTTATTTAPATGGDTSTGSEPHIRVMSQADVHQAYSLVAKHKLPADFARQHIESGGTMDAFRTLVLDRIAEVVPQISSRHLNGFDETFENPGFLSRSIEDALYARMSGKAPTPAAREFMGRSLLQIGETILHSRGEKVSWQSRDALAGRILSRDFSGGLSTSDLPTLLTSSGNRVLQDAYLAAQSPIKSFARHRDANDFRPLTTAKIGNAPELKKVLEGGEVTHGAVSENKESFRLATYARIFGVTRQAIINDDLYAFAQTNESWGQAAANLEAEQLVGLLIANSGNGATLDDGNPLYTTARKNKAAAGASMSVTSLSDARQAMRSFKGLDGKLISSTPKHLLVGPAKETEAQQFIATGLYPSTPTATNPFAGAFELHVEPRIASNAWWLFSSEIATIVMAHLAGVDGPQVEAMPGWTTLGVEFRCVHDFGCGVQEWRGSYLNPGN